MEQLLRSQSYGLKQAKVYSPKCTSSFSIYVRVKLWKEVTARSPPKKPPSYRVVDTILKRENILYYPLSCDQKLYKYDKKAKHNR